MAEDYATRIAELREYAAFERATANACGQGRDRAANAERQANELEREVATAIRSFQRLPDGPEREARWNELIERGILVR